METMNNDRPASWMMGGTTYGITGSCVRRHKVELLENGFIRHQLIDAPKLKDVITQPINIVDLFSVVSELPLPFHSIDTWHSDSLDSLEHYQHQLNHHLQRTLKSQSPDLFPA